MNAVSPARTESTSGQRKTTLRNWGLLLFPVLAIWILSTLLRLGDWQDAYPSMEATYHSILTVKAQLGNPISDHLALPTVTLGGLENHGISWGSTVPTPSESYIYTSFPALGFLLPTIAVGLTGGGQIFGKLFFFGAFLGLGTSWLLASSAFLIIQRSFSQRSTVAPLLIGTIVGLAYLFSPEALLSQGVLFWPHSLAQLFWALGILGVTLTLIHPSSRLGVCIIVVSVVLFALTEWTGYIAGAGIAAVFGVIGLRGKNRRYILLSVLVAIGLMVAFALTLLHFAIGVGTEPLLEAWRERFLARSTSAEPLPQLVDRLMRGLGGSLGLLPVVLTILGVFVLVWPPRTESVSQNKTVFGVVMLISLIPLIENLVLLQHAVQFSFDRLKWLIPLTLSGAFLAAFYRDGFRPIIPLLLVCLCAIGGVLAYDGKREALNGVWEEVNKTNQEAVGWTKATIGDDYKCASLSSEGAVRGYINFLFGRGIHEFIPSLESARAVSQRQGRCATIYIKTEPLFTDLVKITEIVIQDRSGRVFQSP